MPTSLWKAVSVVDGKYYSLGMGPAKIIHLPRGEWINGGEYGISAGMTRALAGGVVYQAKRRTTIPIPPDMIVIPILGAVRFMLGGRMVICDEIFIGREKDNRGAA